uniref:E3 ubiquitin-protein ligase listerin n=1 Tax=Kalanchoe fedtschenkoi TaxID=63787 RepID=A0A7N0RAK5_KALFE
MGHELEADSATEAVSLRDENSTCDFRRGPRGSVPSPRFSRMVLVAIPSWFRSYMILQILRCIFRHVPLDLCTANHVLKEKDAPLPIELYHAVTAATQAIKTGSLLFSVESLWPIKPSYMTSLSGALFGLMLRQLSAYVRECSVP